MRLNGKDIFVGRIYGEGEGNDVIRYHGDAGPRRKYDLVGSCQTAVWGLCLDVDSDGLLWIGSYWDVGTEDLNGRHALDPRNDFAIVNQFGANVWMAPWGGPQPPEGSTFYAPRGVACSADFQIMYTVDFDGNAIKKWHKGLPKAASIVDRAGLDGFYLGQNFPNPFNQVTTIVYEIPEAT